MIVFCFAFILCNINDSAPKMSLINMYSYNKILKKCIETTQKRKKLIYREPLKLDIHTLIILFEKAKEKGIPQSEWLPGTTLYISLQYALSNFEETTKLPCTMKKYNDLCCLADILDISDDWKRGIKMPLTDILNH